MTEKNDKFKNILPPLKLLTEVDRQELLFNLKELNFDIETLKAA